MNRTFEIKFEETKTGCHVETTNDGFNALELIGLLQLKILDIAEQVKDPTKFERNFLSDDGKLYRVTKKEENDD